MREKGRAALLTARIMGHRLRDRLGPARRTARLGTVTRVLSREQAEDMVCQLAAYHGAFWDDPRLTTAGGTAPTFDEAWLRYRQQVFRGVFAWVGTIGAGRMQPEMQPRDICLANIERITRAVVDLKSLDALDES